jgi:hypothetical protein
MRWGTSEYSNPQPLNAPQCLPAAILRAKAELTVSTDSRLSPSPDALTLVSHLAQCLVSLSHPSNPTTAYYACVPGVSRCSTVERVRHAVSDVGVVPMVLYLNSKSSKMRRCTSEYLSSSPTIVGVGPGFRDPCA